MDAVRNGSKNVEEKKMEATLKQLSNLIKDDDSILLEDNDKNRDILKRYLRARKFNVERALKSVKKYFKFKTTNTNMLTESRPEVFRNVYAKHGASVLKNRDTEGRQVMWIKTISWDPAEFTQMQWLISVYLVMEEMVLSADTQRNGIILILDFGGLSLNQLRHISIKPYQMTVDLLQETLPVSFKEIHIINQSVLFKIGWAMVKPFIKEKLRKRIQFHGDDMGGLHKFISPSILPSEMGGQLSLKRALDNDFLNAFLQKNSLYTLY